MGKDYEALRNYSKQLTRYSKFLELIKPFIDDVLDGKVRKDYEKKAKKLFNQMEELFKSKKVG